jgi:lipoprotein signal peptidase
MTYTATATTSPNHAAVVGRRRRLCFLTAALTAVVDLTSKAAVALLAGGHRHGLLLPLDNPRFTLGVLGFGHLMMVGLMSVGILAVLVLGLPNIATGRVDPRAVGLVVGGAAANTLDRAINGAVHDFLIVGPIIVNLADLAVLVGLTWAGLSLAIRRCRI